MNLFVLTIVIQVKRHSNELLFMTDRDLANMMKAAVRCANAEEVEEARLAAERKG